MEGVPACGKRSGTGWALRSFQPEPFQDSNSSAREKACWELLCGKNNLQKGLILEKLAGRALVEGEEELGVCRVECGM